MEEKMNEIPKWGDLLGITLRAYQDGASHHSREIKTKIADSLNLPSELRSEKTRVLAQIKLKIVWGGLFILG